jgi:hypothetical protein
MLFFARKQYHPGRPFVPAPLLFQNKQNSKNKSGKNKTTQSKIKKRVSGNGHGLPHFIAITRVAIAEIRAVRAAIRPETATIHVAAPSFCPFSVPEAVFSLPYIIILRMEKSVHNS